MIEGCTHENAQEGCRPALNRPSIILSNSMRNMRNELRILILQYVMIEG